jgi:hypothetical protein
MATTPAVLAPPHTVEWSYKRDHKLILALILAPSNNANGAQLRCMLKLHESEEIRASFSVFFSASYLFISTRL